MLDVRTGDHNSTSSANFSGVVKNDGFDGNIGIEKTVKKSFYLLKRK